MDNDILWKAISAVIGEAEGRYGLILYGRVNESSPDTYMLNWISKDGGASLSLSAKFILQYRGDIPQYVVAEVEKSLREIAKQRDRVN